MKTICYKSKAIQGIILLLAICFLVSLWPFRLWNEIVTASVPVTTGAMSEQVTEEHTLLQSFVAQYDHMDTISFFLGEETTGDSFYCRILDEQYQVLCEEVTQISPDTLPGYQKVMIDVDLEVGKMYYCILQGNASVLFVGQEAVSMTDMPYAGVLYYDDTALDGVNLVADYNYIVPLRKGRVLLWGALIAALTALLLGAVRFYYRKKEDPLITVEKVVKYTMNPLTALLLIVCMVAVLTGSWSHYLLDNTVYVISILLLGLLLFYGINHNRDGQEPIFTKAYISSHIGDLLQSFFIAGAVGACCEYMSGLYDIHHAVAERKEMIFFALAILAMYRFKELVNLYNAIYLVAAGTGGLIYYKQHLTSDMEALDQKVLKLTVWVAVLLGMIVWNQILSFCKKRIARPAFLYGGLLTVFFAAIMIFRNGRWWTVAMAVSFTLFYLTYGRWAHKERLLMNICRGLVLQFVMATGYAWLHRPYVTYRTARYTHIFHTVTITATYLTIIECAAIVLFLGKFRKSHKWKDIWKEAVLLGVVSSYMVFTMARTGYFAVAVTILFALLLMAGGKKMARVKNIGVATGMMLLSLLICMPVTFVIQRTLPALVSDPYVYEIESYLDDNLRGRKVNSVEYMRVGRFIDVFCDKILNIPEGTFDIYGEIAEFNATHDVTAFTAREVLPYSEESRFYVVKDTELLASTTEEVSADYTNGRIDIFRSYLEQLNLTGHEEMGATLQDGSIATHAHDIYLQVAYDHGIPVGILFVLVGIGTFIKACIYFYRHRDEETCAALPAIVTAAVAVAGIVEWIYHLSNPCGFVLMLVLAPLIFDRRKQS